MNWGKARQGRREKLKGEKRNEKKGKRTTVLVTCTLSRALKLFFLVLLLAFFF